MNNIVVFNNYIEKKKFFINSNLTCDNKIKISDIYLYSFDIDLYNNLNLEKNKINNINEKFKIFIN